MPLDMSPTDCGKCVRQEAQGAVVTQQIQSAGSVCCTSTALNGSMLSAV